MVKPSMICERNGEDHATAIHFGPKRQDRRSISPQIASIRIESLGASTFHLDFTFRRIHRSDSSDCPASVTVQQRERESRSCSSRRRWNPSRCISNSPDLAVLAAAIVTSNASILFFLSNEYFDELANFTPCSQSRTEIVTPSLLYDLLPRNGDSKNCGFPPIISARLNPPPRVAPTVHHVESKSSFVSPGLKVTSGTILRSFVFDGFDF